MSARRNAHATQSHAWLSVEMAMLVREINQMAPTPSISGSHRRQQHITCAACPNPAARLLTVAQPIGVESHSTGAPQRDTPRADFCPHRFRPFCDHASGKDLLRSPIVMPFQASWSAKYSSDSIASIEIAPAPKGFLPPATGDLGCAVRNDPPGIPGVRTAGPQGTRAAISDVKCRQEGDTATDRDRPASLHHAMMPSQAILPDCADESCTATLEPRFQGERCHALTSKYRNQATDYGCPARLAPKKQRLI